MCLCNPLLEEKNRQNEGERGDYHYEENKGRVKSNGVKIDDFTAAILIVTF
jgi:hypothetical protein